jgi:outer membrane protein assembly factor BamA
MRLLFLILAALCGSAWADIKIRLEGNDGLGKRKLQEVIDPEPEAYDKDGLRAWREDAEFYILDLYRVYGYFEAQVRSELARKGGPDAWEALFTIREGPRYAFDTVRVRGADLRQGEEQRLPATRDSAAGPTATVSAPQDTGTPVPLNPRPPARDTAAIALPGPSIDTNKLEARPGKPFRQDALLADRRYLMRRYGDAGFVRVEADDKIEVRKATHTVAVDYLIDPGRPVLFDTMVVRNLRAPPMDSLAGITREDLLQGLVPYARGDTVRMGKNDKLVEKLQYTGAFNFVRIKDSLRDDAEGRSTLFLYTEEHVPGNLRSSVFYETQYGPGVSVDGRHSNVAGSLNEARSGFSVAKERQTLYAGYGSPLTLGLLVRFDDDMDFNWYQDQHPIHDTVGLFGGDFRWTNSSRLTWPRSYWLRLVADAQFEALSRMISPTVRDRDFSLNFIQTAFITFVDQPMDPAKGVRLAFTWGNGGALQRHNVFRFAQYRHNWLEAKTAHYFYPPGFGMLKFATRLDGGRFFGEGGPNSERFFLGGSRSVRSYDFQHLCPEGSQDSTSVCVAQDSSLAYVMASAELRGEPFWFVNPRGKLRHFAPLQIVPFVDFGKVWDVRHATRFIRADGKFPAGQGYAFGLGLRYPLLGIFNLRTDFVLKGSGGHFFWLDLAQAF